MNWLQTFILLVLVFIIACLINIGINYSLRDQLKKKSTDGGIVGSAEESAETELLCCSKELNDIAGGKEKVMSLKILDKMTPYLKEVKSSEDVEEYLIKYFEYPKKELKELKDNLSTRAPKKYRFLHTLIEDIVYRNSIESPEQFFKKSKLKYKEFLPKKTRRLLTDAKRLGKITTKDIKKISKLLDHYLSEEGTYLTKNKLEKEAESFIRSNKVFKLKADKAKLPPAKLDSLIDKDPSKVFELDWLGMIPAMYSRAVKNRKRSKDDDLKRQLERDVETINLFRKYPEAGAYTPSSIREIVRRMEKATRKLYGPRYTSSLLNNLYREQAYLDKYSAERDARSARTERDTERRRREQAEQAQQTARQQQEAADRALAERLQREKTQGVERDAANERREQEMREQVHVAEQAALAANRARDAQEEEQLEEAGIDINNPPPGVDPELWRTMGAAEKKDNILNRSGSLTDEEMDDLSLQ